MKHLLLLLALATALPAAAQTREIALRPGSSFRFSIAGVPAEEAALMNQTYTVRENGNIKLSYLDEFNAAGMKPSELARKIEQLYKTNEIYTNPSCNVTIDMKDDPNRVVFVNGKVKTPTGAVPYQPGITAFQAIGLAGGANEFGKLERVLFIRRTESGQIIERRLDLRKPNSPDATLELLPGDQLTVTN